MLHVSIRRTSIGRVADVSAAEYFSLLVDDKIIVNAFEIDSSNGFLARSTI